MNRRESLMASASAFFASLRPSPEPKKLLTPREAGFTGKFIINGRASCHLARCAVDNPKRYSIENGRMGYWKREDGSVDTLIWRGHDGTLFRLVFERMETQA